MPSLRQLRLCVAAFSCLWSAAYLFSHNAGMRENLLCSLLPSHWLLFSPPVQKLPSLCAFLKHLTAGECLSLKVPQKYSSFSLPFSVFMGSIILLFFFFVKVFFYSTLLSDSTMSIFLSLKCITMFTNAEKPQVIRALYTKLCQLMFLPNITASTSTVTITYL